MNKSSEASPPFESHEEANQDDDISKKVKQLELSLPRKKGISAKFLYLYQNFWVPSPILGGIVSFQEKFQAQDSDILIISKPKSGTTWLQALAFAILNRGIYPTDDINNKDPNCKPHPLLSHHPQQLVPKLEMIMSQTSKLNLPNDLLESHHHHGSRVFATHLPYNALPDSVKTSGCRIVYISRNILDTVISYWFFSHQIKDAVKAQDSTTLEDYVDSVCRGEESYGPHWDHVLGYWQESLKRPNKVLFMKYEDIKGNEISEIKRLAEFMGCPFTSDEKERGVIEEIARLCSIRSLKELEVNKSGISSIFPMKNSAFFRKGEVGDWMNHMSPSMADHLEKVMDEKFLGSGLTFKTIPTTSTTTSS